MSKYVFMGIAAILSAAGNAAKSYAEGNEPALDETGGGEAGGEAAPAKRGRPAKAPAETPAKGKTKEELMAIIQPAVDAGQGAAVKKLIPKHGGTSLADIPPANQAAFIADVEALVF